MGRGTRNATIATDDVRAALRGRGSQPARRPTWLPVDSRPVDPDADAQIIEAEQSLSSVLAQAAAAQDAGGREALAAGRADVVACARIARMLYLTPAALDAIESDSSHAQRLTGMLAWAKESKVLADPFAAQRMARHAVAQRARTLATSLAAYPEREAELLDHVLGAARDRVDDAALRDLRAGGWERWLQESVGRPDPRETLLRRLGVGGSSR